MILGPEGRSPGFLARYRLRAYRDLIPPFPPPQFPLKKHDNKTRVKLVIVGAAYPPDLNCWFWRLGPDSLTAMSASIWHVLRWSASRKSRSYRLHGSGRTASVRGSLETPRGRDGDLPRASCPP